MRDVFIFCRISTHKTESIWYSMNTMQTLATLVSLQTAKAQVDEALADYFAGRRTESVTLGQNYTQLWRTLESLVMSGGKRFRPYMLLMSYQAYAVNPHLKTILPAALAQELLHQAMLIHDDIIDRDTIRYGVANIAGQYTQLYAPYLKHETDRTHMATSAALLAGDLLLSDAHALLYTTPVEPEVLRQATAIFSNSVFEVVGGELLDTEVSFLPKGTITAEIIARYKTASYSFVSPLTMGAVLGGADQESIRLLTELSLHIGIGFQLRDDLLGVFGSSAQTGKSTTSDLTEGKRTYLIEQFEQRASPQQQEMFMRAFHSQSASEDELSACKAVLIESGARAAVEAEIERHHEAARRIIASLKLADEPSQAFYELADKCLTREV